jgi:hypothetical protein
MHPPRARTVCVSLLAAAALSATTPAITLAQTKPAPAGPAAPAEADKTIAAERYTKGSELAKQKKWQEAYPALLDAWNHLRHWQIASALGSVELELGKFHAASQHLSFALAAKDLPEVDRTKVTRLLTQAEASVGTLRIEATAQAPAQVWVDDELVGTTPFSGTSGADPGEHRIELRVGERREGRTLLVRAGAIEEVRLELRLPELDAPPPAPSPPPVPIKPEEPRGPAWTGVIGLAGGAIAGAALGAGLWAASDGKASEATAALDGLPQAKRGSYCFVQKGADADCNKIGGALAAQDSLQTGAALAWVGGATAGALAVALWAWTRRAPARTGLQVVPVVAREHAGLFARGSW